METQLSGVQVTLAKEDSDEYSSEEEDDMVFDKIKSFAVKNSLV